MTFLYPVTGAFPMPGKDQSILGPDMSVNIECLLEKIPERKRDAERKQVKSRFAANLSYDLFPNVHIFTPRSCPDSASCVTGGVCVAEAQQRAEIYLQFLQQTRPRSLGR